MSSPSITTRTVQFRPGSRNLFFHILTKCNLRCKHCYINEDEHGEDVLDLETITSWLRIFSRSELDFEDQRLKMRFTPRKGQIAEETNVIFLGGEPTLNKALPEAIKEARALGFRSITIDTNGYLFFDFLKRTSPELVDNICFSLDGSNPDVNDPIRGKGSFETCVSGIRKALLKGYNVSVIFTVNSLNLDDLENMPDLLANLGVRRFFIQVVGIRGRPARDGAFDLQVSYEKWLTRVPGVAQRAAQMGVTVNYPKVFLSQDEEFLCAGLEADNYFVFPNGRVYTCPLCEDHPIHSFEIKGGRLILRPPITELDLFGLDIPEGCVMNRILHPQNIPYDNMGKRPLYRIACCMVKEEVLPS